MIKFYLATLVLENKITLEQAEELSKKFDKRFLPETIQEIVNELKEIYE